MLGKISRAHDDKYCLISPPFGRQKRKNRWQSQSWVGGIIKDEKRSGKAESGKDRKMSGVSLEKE